MENWRGYIGSVPYGAAAGEGKASWGCVIRVVGKTTSFFLAAGSMCLGPEQWQRLAMVIVMGLGRWICWEDTLQATSSAMVFGVE